MRMLGFGGENSVEVRVFVFVFLYHIILDVLYILSQHTVYHKIYKI